MANTMWAIVAVLLWVVELLVWWTLIPLIVHSLGIRLPLWRYPSTAALGLWQAVFVETLKVGVGFWLLHATTDCIACHFEYRSWSCRTPGSLLLDLAEYVFTAGVLAGLILPVRRRRRGLASPD
jgi:hypothetical protein